MSSRLPELIYDLPKDTDLVIHKGRRKMATPRKQKGSQAPVSKEKASLVSVWPTSDSPGKGTIIHPSHFFLGIPVTVRSLLS